MPQQHQTGPLAILEALRGLDLDKLEQEAQEGIRSGTKTSRAGHVKRLNAIKGLRRTGVAPAELMVTSIPVIPPKFRPFAQQGDTLIAGDANILYKDFIEQNDAFKQERDMFGDANAGQGRLDLYDTAKALYGYGDPVKEKTRQKDIRGFLKKIVGRTSKTGYFQSRMISKTQDSVGRSTIIVDPELGMDEIGLPRDMAMTMYAPHVQRRLRQTGMADSDALKAVRDRAPVAMNALEREVEVRPVVYSRAPAWYQHNIIGGNVKLVDGDAISISPAVTTGLSADFDGDQQINRGLIALDFEAIKPILPDFYEKYKDCSLQLVNPMVTCGHSDEEGDIMFKHIKTAINDGKSVVAVDFEDFPHTDLSNVRKDDKYDIEFYNVPDGICVAAYDEVSRRVVWAPVKYWSVHRGKSVEIVNLDDGSQIYTDDDPRAVYGIARDADTLVPQRFTPTEAEARGVMVPQSTLSAPEMGRACRMYLGDNGCLQDTPGRPVDYSLGMEMGASVMENREGRWPEWYTVAGTEFIDGFIDGLTSGRKLSCVSSRSLRLLRETRDALRMRGIRSSVSLDNSSSMDAPEWKLSIAWPAVGADRQVGVKGSYIPLPAVVADAVKAGMSCYKVTQAYREKLGDSCSDAEWEYRTWAANVATAFYAEEHRGYITKDRALTMMNLLRMEDARREGVRIDGICILRDIKATGRDLSAADSQALMDAVRTMYAANDTKNPERNKLTNRIKNRVGKKLPASLVSDVEVCIHRVGIYKHAEHPVVQAWEAMAKSDVNWRYIESVEKTGRVETGYDLTVPGYETFMSTEGIILSNTINVHVPATDEAVKETYEALMPSAHPYDDRSGDTIKPKLKQEQVLGLYDIATRPASGTYRFATTAEALKAVREGAVPLDADLEVGDLKPVEKQASLVSFINNKAKDIAMTPVSGIMNMELPHSVDSDGDGVPDEITPEEASDMLRELYGIDLPDADASTLRDVQGIVSWLKAHREGEKVAEYVGPSMDVGERTVSGETLKALEMMYGVSFPDIMKGGAKAVDVVRYLAKECKGRLGLAKEAAGKMMEVAFKNLEQSGEIKERRTKGIVYMPECEEYRGILSGDDRKAKAKLVQKFVLNQAPGVVYAACDAYVVK